MWILWMDNPVFATLFEAQTNGMREAREKGQQEHDMSAVEALPRQEQILLRGDAVITVSRIPSALLKLRRSAGRALLAHVGIPVRMQRRRSRVPHRNPSVSPWSDVLVLSPGTRHRRPVASMATGARTMPKQGGTGGPRCSTRRDRRCLRTGMPLRASSARHTLRRSFRSARQGISRS